MLMTILENQRANNKEIKSSVTAEILKAYRFYIDNLVYLSDQDKTTSIVTEEFENFSRKFENSQMRLLEEKWQFLILSPSTGGPGNKGIPAELSVPSSDEDLVTREMFMFLIFKKLRYGIIEDSIMLADEQRICDRFSEWVNLHPSHALKTGDILHIEGRIIKSCWIKKGQEKV